MRFIELFAGIGGFRFGLEKANNRNCDKGENWKSETGLQPNRNGNRNKGNFTDIGSGLQSINNGYFQCIYANEWDKYACQIYRKNFGDKELIEEDIRNIPTESIPNHDLLVAGFPCQSFSIAGKRKGFGDTRGTLFFEICRIVEEKKPNLLLLENVKGLLNHDGGNTFRIILDSLSELGYNCEWEVLNSKNFGVPQNRERVFIIGHLRGTGGQKVFPIGEDSKEINELCGQQTSAITARRGTAKSDGDYIIEGNGKALQQINKNQSQGYRVYNKNGISPTIPTPGGGHHIPKIEVLFEGKKYKRKPKNGKIQGGDSSSISSRVYSPKGLSVGLMTQKRVIPQIESDSKIRRLTPTECERLQGFPDGWTEGISDTQRYKCLGNAVTTNVITEIGKKILKE